MKNAVVFISVLFMFLSIAIVGCSSESSDNSSKTTLKMYSWRTQDKDNYKEIIDAFEDKYPDIKIKFEPFKATEYDQIVTNALASGSGPDIIQMRPTDKSIQDNGDLVSIDDMEGLENIPDEFKEAAMDSEGEVFGVPLTVNNGVIFYNKEIFEEYNLDPPETVDELIKVSEELKENDVTPIAQSGKEGYLLAMLHGIIGPSIYGGNDFVDSLLAGDTDFSDDSFVESIQTIKDLEDFFPDNFVGISDDDAKSLFFTGESAMYINGDYRLEEFKDSNPDLDIGIVPGLAAKKGEEPMITTWVDGSYGVVEDSEHKDEAKKFMEFMTTEEFGQIFTDEFQRVSAVDGVEPEDPQVKEVAEVNDDNPTPYLILQHFSNGEPTTKETFENTLQGMFVGETSLDNVIEETQDSVDKWFEP